MKRIVTILSALLIGTVGFGWLRAREKTTDAIIVKLQAEQAFLNQESEEAKAEHKLMRKTLTRSETAPHVSRTDTLTPALAAWLAANIVDFDLVLEKPKQPALAPTRPWTLKNVQYDRVSPAEEQRK